MKENNYHRRSLLKRGLTLVGGLFFLSASRLGFSAVTKASHSKRNPARRGRDMTQERFIEGVLLGLPVHDLASNKD
jgi:hypothetical protein